MKVLVTQWMTQKGWRKLLTSEAKLKVEQDIVLDVKKKLMHVELVASQRIV